MQIDIWLFVIVLILTFIGGGVLGFFLARRYIMKYFQENPPIDEETVRIMLSQMGRTPSQKQVNQVMKSIQAHHARQRKKAKGKK
ncbi:MAG TPA: YneF family protein, partial [Haloplasmataceae bacterium]